LTRLRSLAQRGCPPPLSAAEPALTLPHARPVLRGLTFYATSPSPPDYISFARFLAQSLLCTPAWPRTAAQCAAGYMSLATHTLSTPSLSFHV
jgi:hypothetical protein